MDLSHKVFIWIYVKIRYINIRYINLFYSKSLDKVKFPYKKCTCYIA